MSSLQHGSDLTLSSSKGSTVSDWFKNITTEEIISVARIEQLHPHDWQKLHYYFPSFTKLAQAKQTELQAAGLTPHQAEVFYRRDRAARQEMKLLQRYNIKVITLADPAYPPLLKEIIDPPLWLFYRGDLSVVASPTLTVVGTRKPSVYAQQVLKKIFVPELLAQLTTVSGLAYGIDKAVHQASLAMLAKTAAVLAGGLDRIYPADHTNLAEQIVKTGGLLLGEYPPLLTPQPYR